MKGFVLLGLATALTFQPLANARRHNHKVARSDRHLVPVRRGSSTSYGYGSSSNGGGYGENAGSESSYNPESQSSGYGPGSSDYGKDGSGGSQAAWGKGSASGYGSSGGGKKNSKSLSYSDTWSRSSSVASSAAEGSSSYAAAAAWESSTSSYISQYTSAADYSTSEYSTTATTSAKVAQKTQYGSGSANWGTDYTTCVQQCQATYGQSIMSGSASKDVPSPPSYSPPPPEASNVTVVASPGTNDTVPLVAGPGQIVVAPIKGDLRFVPFAVNAAAGESIEYIWGAGPHTVTQSSALTVCNKTLEASAFSSGPQNASFKFPITVAQSSTPTFFYCNVPTHCQKGMFGIINPAQASTADASFNAHMSTMASKDSAFAQMMNETEAACKDNSQAAKWGGMFDTGMLPDWALEPAAYNILATRQFFAQNPQVLAATSPASTSETLSNSTGAPVAAVSTSPLGQSTAAVAGASTRRRTPLGLIGALAGGAMWLVTL